MFSFGTKIMKKMVIRLILSKLFKCKSICKLVFMDTEEPNCLIYTFIECSHTEIERPQFDN